MSVIIVNKLWKIYIIFVFKLIAYLRNIKLYEIGPFELDEVYLGDCVELMKQLPSNSIDLVITSPPYDNLRDYKGNSNFDLHKSGKEIYRVLKDGGIAVLVIQDQTINYGKTLTSFKTIIDWCDNIGFKLFETVIYRNH